ncbi:uncharacterized protein VP01_7375g1 [Puccinia sorghi]|uniref:Retrotransposon gag domain-containing protein n=1 Tax=Puccinia sorghi TaxID=27349 RepID=A0A0L6UCL3_9BASI|nr:uncharacterized protein VP01_7375g1 [Puccinia sorghi]
MDALNARLDECLLIGLHTVTYPERFPTNASKPYLYKVFHEVPVVFDDFLNNLRSSFFDHNRQHRAKVALRNLHQTGTVSAYTQDFNQHTFTVVWADTQLMSLYQHSLKKNIQLAAVMSNIDFNSFQPLRPQHTQYQYQRPGPQP